MNNSSTEKFSYKKAMLLCLGVGLLTAGLSLLFQFGSHITLSFDLGKLIPVNKSYAAGLGSSFSDVPAGQPIKLIIPSIGVNAAVQSVGLSWDGNMGIPTNFTDVGWYNQGPTPGETGSAVIDGHLDGKDVKEAVFYNIGKLKPGSLVEVEVKDGKTLKFKVTGSKVYDYNATTTDVFKSSDGKAHLNLITCTGDWIPGQKIYNERVVVFTDLVTTS